MHIRKQRLNNTILHEQDGWTLLELVTVMATIGILAALSINYAIDFLRTTRDTAAMNDAQSLTTIVYDSFLDQNSVDYNAMETVDNRIFIGIKTVDGTPKPPAFRMTPDVEVYLDPSDANRSYPDRTPGSFHAWFYHPFGSKDELGFCTGANTKGRRCFEVWIDEGDSISEILIW